MTQDPLEDLSLRWAHWNEYLFATFVIGRESPGWEDLLSLHDEMDRSYFDTLEAHYAAGRLKVRSWLAESTRNGKKPA